MTTWARHELSPLFCLWRAVVVMGVPLRYKRLLTSPARQTVLFYLEHRWQHGFRHWRLYSMRVCTLDDKMCGGGKSSSSSSNARFTNMASSARRSGAENLSLEWWKREWLCCQHCVLFFKWRRYWWRFYGQWIWRGRQQWWYDGQASLRSTVFWTLQHEW